MNLKEISYSFKKWLFILAIGMILGLGGGYLAIRLQTPVYRATAKILVARTQQAKSSDVVYLSDQQLVQTYIELLKTKPIRDAAATKLGIKINPDNVTVEQVVDTQIVQVIVEDKNSEQAAQIANTLIDTLIEQNNQAQSGRYSSYETALTTQIDDVKKQITSLQNQIQQINQASIQQQLTEVNANISKIQEQITTLEKEIAQFPVNMTAAQRASQAEKQSQLDQAKSLISIYQQIQTNLTYIGKPAQSSANRDDARISSLQLTLNLYQELYLSLINNLQTLQLARFQNTPNITIIDPAIPAAEPVRPQPLFYLALAGVAGLILAFGIIVLMIYLDHTLKFDSDIEELLGLPVLSNIPNHKQPVKGPIVAQHPAAPEARELRTLSSVVSLAVKDKPVQTLMVTSPDRSEGKTTIAANLAAAYSRQGKRILLVDAHFSHPRLDTLLGVNNGSGFADFLHGNTKIAPQNYHSEAGSGFLVLPSGAANPPDEFYQAEKFTSALQELLKQADLIIIDAPPLSNADAALLATQVDGVILVIQSGHTRVEHAVEVTQQLKRMGINILGAVMNRVP